MSTKGPRFCPEITYERAEALKPHNRLATVNGVIKTSHDIQEIRVKTLCQEKYLREYSGHSTYALQPHKVLNDNDKVNRYVVPTQPESKNGSN